MHLTTWHFNNQHANIIQTQQNLLNTICGYCVSPSNEADRCVAICKLVSTLAD